MIVIVVWRNIGINHDFIVDTLHPLHQGLKTIDQTIKFKRLKTESVFCYASQEWLITIFQMN